MERKSLKLGDLKKRKKITISVKKKVSKPELKADDNKPTEKRTLSKRRKVITAPKARKPKPKIENGEVTLDNGEKRYFFNWEQVTKKVYLRKTRAAEIEKRRAEKKKRAAENLAKQALIEKKPEKILRLQKLLRTKYQVWRYFKPLAIGTKEMLYEKFEKEFSRYAIRQLLKSHCKKRRYVQNVCDGDKRYHCLTGRAEGIISNSEKVRAQEMLDEMNFKSKQHQAARAKQEESQQKAA